jgi:hypothetical protein
MGHELRIVISGELNDVQICPALNPYGDGARRRSSGGVARHG